MQLSSVLIPHDNLSLSPAYSVVPQVLSKALVQLHHLMFDYRWMLMCPGQLCCRRQGGSHSGDMSD